MAFPADYRSSGRFYVYYTDREGFLQIDQYRRSSDPDRADPDSRRSVIRVPHHRSNHKGGQLQFGSDGYLYAGFGDGGAGGDPDENAQNLGRILGKLIRIAPRPDGGYDIPASNPFRDRAGARPEVFDYGLRNPYRFSFDRSRGSLVIGDVGQDAVEEIDYVPGRSGGRPPRGGMNFGWDVFEGFDRYEDGRAPGHVRPGDRPPPGRGRLLLDHRRLRDPRPFVARLALRRTLRLRRPVQPHAAARVPQAPACAHPRDRPTRAESGLIRRGWRRSGLRGLDRRTGLSDRKTMTRPVRMTITRRAVAVAVAAAALALIAAGAAQAATLSVAGGKTCYRTGDQLIVSGTGFTPGAAVAISLDGDALGSLTADASGNVSSPLSIESLSGVRTRTVTATDSANPANVATDQFLGSALAVRVRPLQGAAGRRLRIQASGFTTGKRLYAHVIRKRYRHDVSLGRLKGACHTAKARRRIIPGSVPAGVYRVQFDTRKRYSSKTKVWVRYRVTVS